MTEKASVADPIRVDIVVTGMTCDRCGESVTGVNVYADGRSRFAPCEHFGAPETDLVPAEKARHVHQIDGSVVRPGAGVATYRIDQTKMEQYILAPEGKAV